jgi:DNA-binding transcriptional ArsR family regulator
MHDSDVQPAVASGVPVFGREDKKFMTAALRVLRCRTRRRILIALFFTSAERVLSLARRVGVAPSTARYHLGVLHRLGLVECHREGNCVWYGIARRNVNWQRERLDSPPDTDRLAITLRRGETAVTLSYQVPARRGAPTPAGHVA